MIFWYKLMNIYSSKMSKRNNMENLARQKIGPFFACVARAPLLTISTYYSISKSLRQFLMIFSCTRHYSHH